MFDLNELGWSDFFAAAFKEHESRGFDIGRVCVEHRDCYSLLTRQGEIIAEVTGKMLHSMSSTADLPKVGDWAVIQISDDGQQGVIHDFLPRRTKLSRKVAGKQFEEQVLATNIDVIFIVQGLDDNFNPRRLERTLVPVRDSGAEPVVVLNKTDLCEDLPPKLAQTRNVCGDARVLALSGKLSSNLDELRELIQFGRTYAFIGSSGVGKSTLINKIVGEEILKTQEVRVSDGRGRHTTSRRELILVPGGGCLIDTPGMRELQLWHADEGLVETFADIEALAADCHFSDCSHTKEIKCAVLAAVENGDLGRNRYESYLKMQRELSFLEKRHSRSGYVEQRKKDKEQGKMYKRILESKKKRRP